MADAVHDAMKGACSGARPAVALQHCGPSGRRRQPPKSPEQKIGRSPGQGRSGGRSRLPRAGTTCDTGAASGPRNKCVVGRPANESMMRGPCARDCGSGPPAFPIADVGRRHADDVRVVVWAVDLAARPASLRCSEFTTMGRTDTLTSRRLSEPSSVRQGDGRVPQGVGLTS
jgi:hypothetical protein